MFQTEYLSTFLERFIYVLFYFFLAMAPDEDRSVSLVSSVRFIDSDQQDLKLKLTDKLLFRVTVILQKLG